MDLTVTVTNLIRGRVAIHTSPHECIFVLSPSEVFIICYNYYIYSRQVKSSTVELVTSYVKLCRILRYPDDTVLMMAT